VKKIKESIFDKLDDSSVKYAFFITYLIGALVIIFGSKFSGQYTSTIILFILMMTYLLGIMFLNKKSNTFVRDEQMGDSFYYLGFLYTLTALAISLFTINEENFNNLLKNFGIAITTTLVGLIGRIVLSQFRESLDEMKEKAEAQISDSARKLNTQLIQSIGILKDQSVNISKNTDKALQDSSSSLRKYMEENSKILQESTEKSKIVIEEFNEKASEITKKISRINIPTDKFEKFEQAADGIVNTLNDLEVGLKKSSAESEIHKVTENFKSLNSSILSQSKLLNEEFTNSKDALENLTKNLVNVAKFISENLKKNK
jgi:ABC-type transporter Mla subunit MlaD